jgi:hypothetical protein
MRVTSEARDALEPGEALVFDWHRVAICCAVPAICRREWSRRRST